MGATEGAAKVEGRGIVRTGLEELVNRLLPEEEPPCGAQRRPGAGDDRPLKRRGDKIGRDGLRCPVCGEPKLGIDYKPRRDV